VTRFLQHPDMDKILSLCKRRGFVFQGSEIYGGLGSTWDYGPLGVELKRNVKEAWWRSNITERDDIVGLDSAILMHRQVWVTSGHEKGFSDPLAECTSCHHRFRTDQLKNGKCPDCDGDLTDTRTFNLMFKTGVGPVEEENQQVAYLRPETAQGIFINFANVLNSTRKKLPFGIGQIGKAFRNEITPGNFIFRTREFEQMEIEYFVMPGTSEEWLQKWVQERFNWYVSYGIQKDNLRIRRHSSDELAHYANDCYDIEYQFPWGWGELEGIADRTDFDLRNHSEASGKDLRYFDENTREHLYPFVIEPSGGVDRATLAFLLDAYDEEPDEQSVRIVLRLHRKLAPITIALLPLSRNTKLLPTAKKIYAQLRQQFTTQFDDTQSIGRRYRRQDEAGTPYCVTVDFDTLEDHHVTIRDRDTMEQIRIPSDNLSSVLQHKLENGW
jgi:glycyl-tRNA synthetase